MSPALAAHACAGLLLLAACGGGQKKASEPGDAPDAAKPATAAQVSPDAVCTKILELKQQGCPFLSSYDLGMAECVDDYKASVADSPKETEQVGRCFVQSSGCEPTTRCIDGVLGQSEPSASEPQPEFRACGDQEAYGPVGYPRAEWEKRRGAKAAKFGDVASSQKEPIEVCGVRGELEWLSHVTCADGKNPWNGDGGKAHGARSGSVGTGGRCGAIIDRYVVACPEKTYEVYMDMYVCALP